MKKFISVFLAIVLMLPLCGCQLLCNHDWMEATCTTPKTCTKCGKVEGQPLGHSGAEYALIYTDYLTATDTFRLSCDLCGEFLEKKEAPSTTFIDDGFFGFTCEEFVNRLQTIWDENYGSKSSLKLEVVYWIGYVYFDAYVDDIYTGGGCYYDARGETITKSHESDRTIRKINLVTYYDNEDDKSSFINMHSMLLDCISMTVDPTIKDSKFKDPICSNTYATGEKALHNIYYSTRTEKENNKEKILTDIEVDAEAFA